MLFQPSLDPIEIVTFWFSPEVKPLWFEKNREFDEVISRRFGNFYEELVKSLRSESWNNFCEGPEEVLPFIITLDQFPRNMFRDTPKAFATDDLALSLSKSISRKGFDMTLPSPDHYNFLYMPFMHSESLEDQEEGLRLFSAISENDETVAYSKWHRDIIEKFGRFPHRNKILGRSSTVEEQEYLKEFKGF